MDITIKDKLIIYFDSYRIFGILGRLSLFQKEITRLFSKIDNDQCLIPIKLAKPQLEFPIYLRATYADLVNYKQVFELQHYEFEVSREPQVIIDAGAYIGLASVLFAHKFPNAKIIAIEPAQDNLELLRRNTAPYPNVMIIPGALWHQNTMLQLHDPGDGAWSYMTQETKDAKNGLSQSTEGLTIDHLLQTQGVDKVDILKVDIEGAEKEVFRTASTWIKKVDALMIELHEWKKPGCNRSFYNATNDFEYEWFQGENVYLAREGSCLTKA